MTTFGWDFFCKLVVSCHQPRASFKSSVTSTTARSSRKRPRAAVQPTITTRKVVETSVTVNRVSLACWWHTCTFNHPPVFSSSILGAGFWLVIKVLWALRKYLSCLLNFTNLMVLVFNELDLN